MSGNTWIALGVLAVTFSAFAIPYGFSLRENLEKVSAPAPTISVKSNDQSGGITANSVTVEKMTIIQGGNQTESVSGGVGIQSDAFALADCTFDAIFEIPADSVQSFQHAFPRESGTITVILQVYQGGTKEQHARLQLTGDWQGTSGMIRRYSEDSVIFTLSPHISASPRVAGNTNCAVARLAFRNASLSDHRPSSLRSRGPVNNMGWLIHFSARCVIACGPRS